MKKQSDNNEEDTDGDDLPSISFSQSSRCEVCVKKIKVLNIHLVTYPVVKVSLCSVVSHIGLQKVKL